MDSNNKRALTLAGIGSLSVLSIILIGYYYYNKKTPKTKESKVEATKIEETPNVEAEKKPEIDKEEEERFIQGFFLKKLHISI